MFYDGIGETKSNKSLVSGIQTRIPKAARLVTFYFTAIDAGMERHSGKHDLD